MKQLRIFTQNGDTGNAEKEASLRAYWKLAVDGASRNNPGPAGAGIYLEKNGQEAEAVGYFLGTKTNNQAEYLALIIGLVHLRFHIQPHDRLLIVSDSQLLIRQLAGEYKVRHERVREVYRVAKQLLEGIRYELMHVLREDNARADHFANVGIDTQHAVPDVVMRELKRYGVVL